MRAHGYHARRGQQFSGSPDSPDVICTELDGIHFEVKAVERLNIYDAMEQARSDCMGESGKQTAESRNGQDHRTHAPSPKGEAGDGSGGCSPHRKTPVVAHRRSHRPWLVTMEAETFFRLLRGELPCRGDASEIIHGPTIY